MSADLRGAGAGMQPAAGPAIADAPAGSDADRRRGRRDRRETWTAVLFVAPSVVGVFLFLLLPVVVAFGLSFFAWNYLDSPEFVGLENYSKLVGDAEVANGLKVTAWYILLHIPIQTALAIFIAVQLNKHIRGRGFFRALYVLPWLTTPW
jgi:ABC-type sugar transport system permease subunit